MIYEKPQLLKLEYCPAVCERAKWHVDPLSTEIYGEERGQYNCPHHFGVDYFAAIQNGEVHCKYLKRKEADQ